MNPTEYAAIKALIKTGALVEARQILIVHCGQMPTGPEDTGPTGALTILGQVHAKLGDPNAALLAFQRAYPERDAFKGSIGVFRAWAKEAKTDPKGSLRMYNHALSCAWMYHQWNEIRTTHADEYYHQLVQRWKAWRRQIHAKAKTQYAFTYAEYGAPPNDRLLTATDYRQLQKLTFGVG